MYKALYRAYRPEVFSQVLGQEHIVKILKHQLEHDETSHAYLFCGTRGTGKTTLARLLAKGVNCTSYTREGKNPAEHVKTVEQSRKDISWIWWKLMPPPIRALTVFVS